MSTLKMVSHVEKTLKITIQKKLPKSQKFARKYPWRSFIIVKPFLGVHNDFISLYLNKKITSNEQKVSSNEQKVRSNEQKVTSNEQKVTSNVLCVTDIFSKYT